MIINLFGNDKSVFISDKLFQEGPEGAKWELGLACFWAGKMRFRSLGLGFGHWEWEKKCQKWEWDKYFEP